MTGRGSILWLVLLGVSIIVAPSAAEIVSFQGLGDLPGGDFYSTAYGVSADGSIVVGRSRSEPDLQAFRWENNGEMVGLGDLSGGDRASEAHGVSADGSVVAGYAYSDSASGNRAFRWESGNMSAMGTLGPPPEPSANTYSHAYDISANGSVVVGRSSSPSGPQAFRWENGEMVGLGDLPGGDFYSTAYGVSADGSIVVGRSRSEPDLQAFRWENKWTDGGPWRLAWGRFL
jgi:probable HAF family extracellular repeat protein